MFEIPTRNLPTRASALVVCLQGHQEAEWELSMPPVNKAEVRR